MEREKLVDISFVFRILEFEVNSGDFMCVTCILYVGPVENFKFAVRICLVEQVAHTSNRRLYHVTFLLLLRAHLH
jgi:hypothetical protein